MLQLDAIIIHTQELETMTKFLVHLFEMEIVGSSSEFVELRFDEVNVRLIYSESISEHSPLFFRSDDLEEIEQMKDRCHFFYFTHPSLNSETVVEDRLSDEQMVRFFDPEGRSWDLLFFS